jgi:hypothetical protein
VPINQTKPRWITARQSGELGTGLYAHGPVERPDFTYVSTIHYTDFERLTSAVSRLLAYQWVPLWFASEAEVRAVDCGNHRCTEDCERAGCICINGTCQPAPR